MNRLLANIDQLFAIAPTSAAVRFLERILFVFMTLMTLFAPHSIAATQSAWIIGMLTWLVVSFIRPRKGWRPSALDIALVTFFLWSVVSSIFSYAPDISLDKLRGVSLFMVFMFVSKNIRTIKAARFLALALVGSAMVAVLWTPLERIIGRGVQIYDFKGSAFDAIGLQEGDVILKIDGKKVGSLEEVKRRIDEHPNDRSFKAQISRADAIAMVDVYRDLIKPAPTAEESLGVRRWTRSRNWRAAGFYGHFTTFAEVLQLIASLSMGLFVGLLSSAMKRRAAGAEERKSEREREKVSGGDEEKWSEREGEKVSGREEEMRSGGEEEKWSDREGEKVSGREEEMRSGGENNVVSPSHLLTLSPSGQESSTRLTISSSLLPAAAAAATVAFMALALLLTVTRASQLAFMIAAAVAVMFVGNRRLMFGLAAVALPVALVGLFVLKDMRRVGFFDSKDNSTTWRGTVYREGFDLWTKSPRNFTVGVGMDSIKRFAGDWHLFDDGRLPPGHFHSTLLQLGVERGFPAVVIWLTILFLYGNTLRRGIKDAGRTESSGEMSRGSVIDLGILLGSLGGLVGFFTSGLVHYNLGDGEVATVFYLIMGLSVTICGLKSKGSVDLPPLNV